MQGSSRQITKNTADICVLESSLKQGYIQAWGVCNISNDNSKIITMAIAMINRIQWSQEIC